MAGTTLVLFVRSFLFVAQLTLSSVRIVYLIGDIYDIISWCRLWETHLARLSLPGHKSCMVLTHSMATTTNVQGDELLQSTALERQVQTLMATVERLTQQNHDLEEQLRQRDARHNI